MHARLSWIYSLFKPLYLFLRQYALVRWFYGELKYWPTLCRRMCSSRWNKQYGLTKIKRDPELIVSLTSIPERIATLHLCLDSLLCQSTKPDRLILWLSESYDTGRPTLTKNNLPESLTRLKKRGLEIRWCEDIRSFRKIVPTLLAHPKATIITADDDILYPKYWIERLYDAYQREPQFVHCYLAHRIKYDSDGKPLPYVQWDMETTVRGPSFELFPTVGAGALFTPGHLHAEVINQDAFLNLCPFADDIWMKAMSLLNDTQVKTVSARCFPVISLRIKNNRCLEEHNVARGQNDIQIAAVNESYSCFNHPANIIDVRESSEPH